MKMNEEQIEIYSKLIEVGQSAINSFEIEDEQEKAEEFKKEFIEEVHELESICENSEILRMAIEMVVDELATKNSYWEVDEWLFNDPDILSLEDLLN